MERQRDGQDSLGGWDEYGRMILHKLDEHGKKLDALEQTKADFAAMKARWGIVVAIAAIIFTAVINFGIAVVEGRFF